MMTKMNLQFIKICFKTPKRKIKIKYLRKSYHKFNYVWLRKDSKMMNKV